MLRWLLLVLVLAASVVVFTNPSLGFKKPGFAPYQCQAHAWVRAPDMVPGDVIAGDVKIKLQGPCTDAAESYTLGLRYKERVFWKLRRHDAWIPRGLGSNFKYKIIDSIRKVFLRIQTPSQHPDYNVVEWKAFQNSVQKALWSVHEEERVAFEIKTLLVGADGTDTLSTNFTTRFGILVPNTNYPPGLDCRQGGMPYRGDFDVISSESIYEYFVEIRFSDGTTLEVPAGITAFTPFYSTKNEAPSTNISLGQSGPGFNMGPLVDSLRSNYTIEVFGARVHQNSSENITAVVHRTGYTNRTDTPVKLCVSPLSGPGTIEWHPQELKHRPKGPFSLQFIKALVPSIAPSMQYLPMFGGYPPFYQPSCTDIKFAAASSDLTHEGHISSTSSEPLSLSLHVRDDVVPNFSKYYQTLGHRFNVNILVKADPSEPWKYDTEQSQWERQTAGLDETEFDWVPWLPPKQTRHRYLSGDANLSIVSMEKQRPAQSTPVHYLSDEARQPAFVKSSDIADLRLMSPEERDLIAPLAQPSLKVFAEGEELPSRYSTVSNMQRPIYVGDTWLHKVLATEGQHERDTMDRLLVVQ
ncbi:uncharacterized protein EDB91DRAFT_328571 [Suillus paluster]|uniref:uncharacterized protein n=1 Tax=Suillus paluster TaxID=48578 RepID=UPI001B879024|nr:uncharacterized protein EDB91DRAFT_328571 [Suillus paluster]KAG1741429.1 hypothetical protein EDB91DRAFT_328571 [Suillus paluster]